MLSLTSTLGTGALLSNIVRDAFQQGVEGLFEDAKVRPIGDRLHDLSLNGETWAGVVGFTANEIRGSLVINMNEPMVVNSLPEAIRTRMREHPDDANFHRTLNDWCGEIANQIVGRAKNRISEYGPLLTLSSPISLRASGMVWGASTSTHEFRQLLEQGEGQILSIASVTIERDHEVEPISANAAATEGEMMMF
ncbi:MAG: chemotaxis protein CheX [Nannocystaceae bacterium]